MVVIQQKPQLIQTYVLLSHITKALALAVAKVKKLAVPTSLVVFNS